MCPRGSSVPFFERVKNCVWTSFRGQATVVEHVPNQSAVHQTIGMISSNFAYAVEPHEDGSVLTLEVEYSVPIPVLGKLAEHIVLRRNEREFQIGLENVKDTLEAEASHPFDRTSGRVRQS